MADHNKALARRAVEEVWNRGSTGAIEELFASDYASYHVGADVAGRQPGDVPSAHASIRQYFSTLRAAFPDMHFTIEDQIAEGDRVVMRWTGRATHLGPYEGLPATGKSGIVTGMTIYRIAGGKVVEGWTNLDELGMLRQLGLLPEQGQAE